MTELKGLTIFPGLVRGKVKIIREDKDISKMECGDILVSPETRPDYVVAMSKAAAIVTDTGGMLCHAAIIAREFRTPCIVRTKDATKVLKDGDLVEVDATKGTVKKL
jgi:pyruvate,water dikinase